MKKFEEVGFNAEKTKVKGYEWFKANIKDLVDSGKIGYIEGGKQIKPSEAEIKAKYKELTGLEVDKPIKPE